MYTYISIHAQLKLGKEQGMLKKMVICFYQLEIAQRRIYKVAYLTRVLQRYLTKFNKAWKK